MKALRILTTLLLCLGFVSTSFAAASTKHWIEQVKAADKARLKRDFQQQRAILEGVAAEAEELGQYTSGFNSFLLAETYRDLRMDAEAVKLVESQLEKIGPKPVEIKLQFVRGALLFCRAHLDYNAKRYDNGLAAAEESKTIFENVFGKFSPELFWSHLMLGNVQMEKGDFVAAEKAYKNALRLAEAQNYVMGISWSGSDESVNMYRMPPPEQGIVLSCGRLSDLYLRMGNYKETERYARKGLKDAEATYNKKSPMILDPLRYVAIAELKLGKRKEFERDCDRLAAVASTAKGFDHWVAEPLWLRFEVELGEQKMAAAKETARKIIGVYANQSFHPASLGRRAVSAAKLTNAVDWARVKAAHEIFDSELSVHYAEPLVTGPFYMEFVKFANDGGPSDVALATCEAFVRTQEAAPDKGAVISVLSKIEEARAAGKEPAKALAARRKITAAMIQKYGDDSRVADSLEREAAHLKELGDDKGAGDAQAQANEIRKKALLKN